MVTKLRRMVSYLEELLPIKSYDASILWSCKVMWQTKIITPPPECLGPVVLPIKSHYSLITWSLEIMWQTNHYIFNTTVLIVHQTWQIVDFKLLEAVVRWSCKITWQTQTIIQSQIQSLGPTKLGGWWLIKTVTWILKGCARYFSFFFSTNDSPKKYEKCFLFHLRNIFMENVCIKCAPKTSSRLLFNFGK